MVVNLLEKLESHAGEVGFGNCIGWTVFLK